MPAIAATASFSMRELVAPAVERVVVRVEPHGERVREPRHRVRRLEHLAGVERMEVRVVVLEPRRDLLENARDLHPAGDARLRGRKAFEALREPLDRRAQDAARFRGGEVGARRAHAGSTAVAGSKWRRASGRRRMAIVAPKKAAPRSAIRTPAPAPAMRIVAAASGVSDAMAAVAA